ncbi:Exocyst complex component exo84 [Neolecta irregularis DAH-3]|uniref:Exocyst complex component EXO84 n=1 Tax=Neolecta irregularis (strain DAH-3) TaxID=1198029 RepID=A0A1U7LVG9_NEOID|nr:Exocyst complex component exo84 [Neolecta irregularis DAH-3]|eukprot:OLL26511.1 Exocyst complex component exo84 [Neolecta irregularis DAH-3]
MSAQRTRQRSERNLTPNFAGKLGDAPDRKDQKHVADRMMRRYSTKPAIGGMPGGHQESFPAGLRAIQQTAVAQENKKLPPVKPADKSGKVDPSAFSASNFNAEQYVEASIRHAKESELQTFYSDLRRIKEETYVNLQRNVFRNYKEFVVIAKEVAHLSSDMNTLREYLTNLQSITALLKNDLDLAQDEDNSIIAQRRHAKFRNSIADLTTIYASQLASLWERVEGSQKYVPSFPGRHIIRECPNFVELHAATYKPKQPVYIVLLDDHLLVATSKTRAGATKLVAEKCWNLLDIELKDIHNSLQLIFGNETYVYTSEKNDDMKTLLAIYKRACEEMKSSMFCLLICFNLLGQKSGSVPRARIPSTILEPAKDLRWIEDRMDELDEWIAHKNFDDAVNSITQGRTITLSQQFDGPTTEIIGSKLDERAQRLCIILCTELSENAGKKNVVRRTVRWLVELGFEDRARSAFSSSRDAMIKQRTRQILFQGEIPQYLSDFALVQFTLMKNTWEMWQLAFQENRMASGFAAWAANQIARFKETFSRQLDGFSTTGDEYRNSIEAVRNQIPVLREVGMDASFLLKEILQQA